MSYEKRTILADEVLNWVGEEVTKKQVESVIWAMAHIQRSNPEMIDEANKEIFLDSEGAFPIEEGN